MARCKGKSMASKTTTAKTRPGKTPVVTYGNRESWLLAAVEALRPDFARIDCPLPAAVHVSVGFTSKGKRSRAIGQCWDASTSADEVAHVFIVPTLADGARVLDVLVHELVHAAVGCNAGHGREFARPARALGLEGKLTATVAGATLSARLAEIIGTIGAYPHGALGGSEKVQGTRMLKVECLGCGMVMRSTAKWLLSVGPPACSCGAPGLMYVPELAEELADRDEADSEYNHQPDALAVGQLVRHYNGSHAGTLVEVRMTGCGIAPAALVQWASGPAAWCNLHDLTSAEEDSDQRV